MAKSKKVIPLIEILFYLHSFPSLCLIKTRQWQIVKGEKKPDLKNLTRYMYLTQYWLDFNQETYFSFKS